MDKRRLILTALWWIWGLFLFGLLIALSHRPLFGSQVRAAWEWFVSNLLPTMSLVGATAYAGAGAERRPDPLLMPAFVLCVAASVAHLAALTFSLLGSVSSATPLDDLRTASLWLGPLQALATSALGVFFLKTSPSTKRRTD